MRKAVVWVIVLVFALGLSIGYYFNKAQAVQTGAVAMHEFTTFIEGAGTVGAPTQLVLTPSDGVVKDMYVREGQHVKAGDALLKMDDNLMRLQLDEALLALNAEKKVWIKQSGQLTRAEQESAMAAAQLTGYGLEQFNNIELSPEEKDVGEEQVDLARLKVQQAIELIRHSTVLSAIDGTVLQVDAREGELAPAGYQAAIVAAMDEAEIESVFADQDAATIEPGMEVLLYGGCLGSTEGRGTVLEIAPMSRSQQAQTGPKSVAVVKIRPDSTSLFERLGASVELKVVTGRKTAVGVPIESLAQDSSGLFVYVIRNGRAYRTPIEVGVLDEVCAEVKSGLKSGDTVALNPTELRNGERVSGS